MNICEQMQPKHPTPSPPQREERAGVRRLFARFRIRFIRRAGGEGYLCSSFVSYLVQVSLALLDVLKRHLLLGTLLLGTAFVCSAQTALSGMVRIPDGVFRPQFLAEN